MIEIQSENQSDSLHKKCKFCGTPISKWKIERGEDTCSIGCWIDYDRERKLRNKGRSKDLLEKLKAKHISCLEKFKPNPKLKSHAEITIFLEDYFRKISLPKWPNKISENGKRADLVVGRNKNHLYIEIGDFTFSKFMKIYTEKFLIWIPKNYLPSRNLMNIFYWTKGIGIETTLPDAVADYLKSEG
ncbi:MAG: hypothetical protein ABIG69_04240 [Bacteroidota bacterium]|uniref:Uncharacterized protein n=1 Tax=viral metagenome TaxID=1070528 RepID=A0A6M3JNW5_9ZZZZ